MSDEECGRDLERDEELRAPAGPHDPDRSVLLKTPSELADARVLTTRIADHHRWEVMAFCDHCGYMRAARGSWKKAAPDRNLIDALERRKLVCFKCHRAAQRLRVGKHWPDGGFQQIMTITIGARIDVHHEEPRYPEKFLPNLGPES